MKLSCTFAGVFALLAPLAHAANCPTPPPQIPPVPELTISREACAFLMQQALAQSAEYKPGVDSAGRAVVPADLPDNTQLKLPETITVEITPALAHWLPNQQTPYDTLELSRINLGIIAVTGGVVTFNGQPIGTTHNEDLLALCTQQNSGQ